MKRHQGSSFEPPIGTAAYKKKVGRDLAFSEVSRNSNSQPAGLACKISATEAFLDVSGCDVQPNRFEIMTVFL